DGEGGGHARAVLGRHRRQTQLPGAIGGDRQADQAARVLGHEIDLFRRRELGRDDDVALVLPILGVDQDVGPPVAGVLENVLDRTDRTVVAVGRQGAHAVSCHRARYRASISISRLTRAPVFSAPRVVCSRVWGMTFTSKRVPSTALTVRDTPSTVIEPLGAI